MQSLMYLLLQEFSALLDSIPHTRPESEIAFDAAALAPETFEQLVERQVPRSQRAASASIYQYGA